MLVLLGHRAAPSSRREGGEDLDSTGPDHAADACRYGLLRPARNAAVVSYRM